MPEKILCLIGQLGNGGTERQLYLFLKNLPEDIYLPQIFVSSKSNGRWMKPIQDLGIDIFFSNSDNPISKLIEFRSLLSKLNPDIIFSWSYFTNAFYIAAPKKTPFIASLRGDLHSARKNLGSIHWNLAFKPKTFVVNSEHLKNQLIIAGKSESHIYIVDNIYDPDIIPPDNNDRDRIRKSYKIPDGARIIIGSGRDCFEKNLPLFIEVCSILLKQNQHFYAFLLGNVGDKIKKKADDINLSGRLFMPGEVENPFEFYRASDLFFLSSRTEGMPNALIEALHCGCVALAMNIGFDPQIVKDTQKYLTILEQNTAPENIAESILETLQKPKPQTLILSAFSKDKVINDYISIIEKSTS